MERCQATMSLVFGGCRFRRADLKTCTCLLGPYIAKRQARLQPKWTFRIRITGNLNLTALAGYFLIVFYRPKASVTLGFIRPQLSI